MAGPEHIDRRRVALIAWDVCRRALTLSDHARRAAIRPVLEAWVRMIAATRSAGRAGDLHDASPAAAMAPTSSCCRRGKSARLDPTEASDACGTTLPHCADDRA